MDTSQQKILDYCLKNCLFDGWNTKLLEAACQNAGLDANYHRILFPGGTLDVIDAYIDQTSQYVANNLNTKNLRTHEKVREAVKLRLQKYGENKEVIKSIMKAYAFNPLRAMQATYRVVDDIWRTCGDTATDWNFYSKRALLAGVYGSTLLHWLNDNSEGNESTWKFLDARLANVAEIGKVKKRITEIFVI